MARDKRHENPGHPRGCGEHIRAIVPDRWQSGSSPRVRGTHHIIRLPQHGSRVIPAGAGNTMILTLYNKKWTGHPRGCGEHRIDQLRAGWRHGSSPRVRGTHVGNNGKLWGRRVIPAGAGNTRMRNSRRWPWTGHPRGCGEHYGKPGPLTWRAGSSPRVRGTRPLGIADHAEERGHPRGCGEHSSNKKTTYQ